jgi:hypothetical protein
MNSEALGARGGGASLSANTEILGGPDKPGHDDQNWD